MRTTLTLDEDIGLALRDAARHSGRPFKAVVNEALRRGLAVGAKPMESRKPFRVASARRGFVAGVDPLKLNQLVDELEVDRFLERSRREIPGS